MIPDLGQAALWIALALALVQGSVPLVGAARGLERWMAVGRSAAQAQCALVWTAFAALAASFLRNDFSVLYVTLHSNSQLPAVYRFAAVWGGHEGSLLLWLALLGGWMLALARYSRQMPPVLLARTLAVMGWVSAGLLLFMLATSNPFERLLPMPPDGADLNPLLQDPGMAIHPPMLYAGYVGFSVAFAMAVAALLGGDFGAATARCMRPWTTAAWCFLTLGIALGSLWAYTVLGWGGWWFWDPVENASLMPWLAGTALMHSLAVTDKRAALKSWTLLLAIGSFSLSLLGTFLVRSGVVASVHAFAADPRRGLFILAFLVIAIGGSLALYAWRAARVGSGSTPLAAVSRESMLLLNNVLLVVATGSVMLGTLYPLLLDAFGLGKVSVGPPYFEAVMVPLMAPLAFLMGVGPLARWKQAELPGLARRLRWAAGVSVAAVSASACYAGTLSVASAAGLWTSAWIAGSIATDLVERIGRFDRSAIRALAGTSRAQWGMWLAHLGVAIFAFGVSMVGSLADERDLSLAPGQGAEVAGMHVRLDSLDAVSGPNYDARRASISITRDGAPVALLQPEKRVYRAQGATLGAAAISRDWRRDVYVSLGEPLADGRWSLRVYVKPFVAWIWGGCLTMALGGALAASDRRYRAQRALAPSAADAMVAQGLVA